MNFLFIRGRLFKIVPERYIMLSIAVYKTMNKKWSPSLTSDSMQVTKHLYYSI